jgi:hypothetical protein
VTLSLIVCPAYRLYQAWDAQPRDCGQARDAVSASIRSLLDQVEFAGARLDHHQAMGLIAQSDTLIEQIQGLAADSSPPADPACQTGPGSRAVG